jgi:hypothetical protein
VNGEGAVIGSGDAAAWFDKLAIQEVIDGYCDALNRDDWDAYEALFTPDAVWEESAVGLQGRGCACDPRAHQQAGGER